MRTNVTRGRPIRPKGWMAAVLSMCTVLLFQFVVPQAAFATTAVKRICDGWAATYASVSYCIGFDFNGANNHLRAYGRVVSNSVGSRINMTLVLGDGNGVISTVHPGTFGDVAQTDTGYTLCHFNYSSYYNVRITFTVSTYTSGGTFLESYTTTARAYHWLSIGNASGLGACSPGTDTYYPYGVGNFPNFVQYSTTG